MESILAAISTLAILAAITAWVLAWKINADWVDFYRMICEKKKRGMCDGRVRYIA